MQIHVWCHAEMVENANRIWLGGKAQDYLSAKNMELWGEMQNDGL